MIESSEKLLNSLKALNVEFNSREGNKKAIFKKLLTTTLEITESEYGFIGEVLFRENKPYLKTYAITDISWNEETRSFYKKYEEQGMEFTNLETLFGYTLKTGELVISNNPSKDPRSGGIPKGHPSLNHYLGIPIKDKNGLMIGMIGLANKPGGYNERHVEFYEPLIALCSSFILTYKAEEKQAFFSKTLDFYKKSIDEHAIVSVTDANGVITYVNDKFCEISQYTTSELIGKTHRVVNSGYHNAEFFKNLWDTILSGKIWRGEVRNKAKDGSIYWVEATIIPYKNESDEIEQFIAIRTDITGLKHQQKLLSNFFRLSVDFLCIIRKNGMFKKVSQSFCEALGYSEASLLKSKFEVLIHPDDKERTTQTTELLVEKGRIQDFTNRYFTKDGKVLHLSWRATYDSDEELIYATATDITEKLAVEEKLIQSKVEQEKAKAKDVFLANMSHEIRTPLNAIIGFNDLLRQTNLNQEQNKYIEIISSALKNLHVIINDILDYSKLESGKIELEKEAFEVERVVKQVIQMQIESARSKNIKLMLSYDGEIPSKIIGDETRLSQILINLVSNAIKFTQTGSVELRVTETSKGKNETTLLFAVKDTGIGIEPSKLNLIFDRFTQAENYTTRLFGGTGLGLNIVKTLVELHNGKLEVKSQPGIGSEFSFQITYSTKTEGYIETGTVLGTSEGTPGIPGVRILLVEDNVHNQILAQKYLEKNGASVELAGNGLIGLEALKSRIFDVVLMDVQMPILDGISTTHKIREELKMDVPIIGCSAHALSSEKQKCLQAGMNYYISKPFSESTLISSIQLTLNIEYTVGIPESMPEGPDNLKSILEKWDAELGANAKDVLLELLINRVENYLNKSTSLLETKDFVAVEMDAHALAGSLAGMRLMEGLGLARKMEKSAREKDMAAMEINSRDLNHYLQALLDNCKSL